MGKIIGIGNALVDVLIQLHDETLLSKHNLPKGGMTLIDSDRQQRLWDALEGLHSTRATGGCAGNTALSLAHLGASPGFIGVVGRDEMGCFFRRHCELAGIEARLAEVVAPTGVANTFITPDGERTFATCLGAASCMEPHDISPDLFHGYQLLHIEGYLVQNHELIDTICRTAKAEGLILSIDLASYNVVQADREFFSHLLKDYIDIVFANKEEALAYTLSPDPREALAQLASMVRVAVVKLGAEGAAAMQDSISAFAPAVQVQVVDTTAAGDFFAGGFLYAWSQGASLEACLQCGNLLASNVIQVVGTRLQNEVWNTIQEEITLILI